MTSLRTEPDPTGSFGEFGGRYVPETLVAALDQLTEAWHASREDAEFQAAALNALGCDFQLLGVGYLKHSSFCHIR